MSFSLRAILAARWAPPLLAAPLLAQPALAQPALTQPVQGPLAIAPAARPAPAPDPVTGWTGFLGIGPAFAPEYAGAETSQFAPFVMGELSHGPYFLQLRGLGLRANLLPSRRLVAGPVLRLAPGRDDDVDNDRVARLDEIDPVLEAGGFVALRLGGDARGQGQVELSLTATGSSNGAQVSAGLSYAALRGARYFVNLDTELSYADGDYTRTHFGVTRAEALRSGLPEYRPAAGLRDAGLGLTAGYQLTDHWGLTGRLSYSYLLGDAADSPIVRLEGNRNQLRGGLAVTYRF
ncbi:MipA/OmpV family protein [Pseudoroseomonas cervicalis]|uniref:MipA/OmpV family protein n=1 Tax=Teichococcus cervicalis TaxID=204525 RepID=UPI002786ABAA|nr:MipA/OmpV family protein [Pseudoroseomonas cervicalis]MDQ1081624.1 outer membrane protein [Pseudoroseomonas cervicalis]